jgi:hypothetical protein
MRAKVVIPMLLVGICAALLPLMIGTRNQAASGPVAGGAIAADTSMQKTPSIQHLGNMSGRAPGSTGTNVIESTSPADNSADAANEMDVAARIAELERLGMTDESNSLLMIESDFDSREPRIQEAAVAAAVQFGSRDAIPALQYVYLQFDDPEQKLNIQKAIGLLELPSMGEAGGLAAQSVDTGR